MRKCFFTCFIVFILGLSPIFSGTHENTQLAAEVEPSFREGDIVLNVGLGLGSAIYVSRFYSPIVPPISISIEYGYMEDFTVEDLTLGLGGYLGYTASRDRRDSSKSGENYFILGGRGGLHYPFVEDLDTYVGVMLGVNIITGSFFGDKDSDRSSRPPQLIFSLYAGGRYYVTEELALMAEIGYGVAYLSLGIAYRL